MEGLKSFIRRHGIVAWVILCVGGMFVISLLVLALFKSAGYNAFYYKLTLPLDFGEFIRQPWSLLTYWLMIHPALFLMILFDLLFLWTFSNIFKMLLGQHRLRNLLVFATFVNALIILLIGAAIQGGSDYNKFLGHNPHIFGLTPMVITLIAATITFRPMFPIRVFIFGMVPIIWVGLFIIGIDVVTFRGGFSIGGISVIISGLIGFAYGKMIQNGSDFTSWLDGILDRQSNNRPASRRRTDTSRSGGSSAKVKTRLKVVKEDGEPDEDEINRILDKINNVGYDGLTRKEKETLARYSKD